MTTGSPPSITATTEFVVPRSIPIILLMSNVLAFRKLYNVGSIKYERHNVKVRLLGGSRHP
jgi:hypothetical protein